MSDCKTLAELVQTKKRLADLEESKMNLSTQVISLKEQLNKFEQEQHMQQQLQQRKLAQEDTKCNCNVEIQNLKAEVARSKSGGGGDSSGEIVRALEKYERQKDALTENNQVVCLLEHIGQLRERVFIVSFVFRVRC